MSIYFPVFFHFFVWSHADMINVINSTEGVLYVKSNDDALVLARLY